MKTPIDITGQRFGRLVALNSTDERKWKFVVWECQCDCGKVVRMTTNSLRSAGVKSCGCLTIEDVKARFTKHGDYNSPTHRSWTSMLTRCRNKNAREYQRYGAVGITVSEDWYKYENFLRDMGDRPEGTSIDRIDNSKGYSKDNCRWATKVQQARNKKKPSTSFETAEKIRALRAQGMRPKDIQTEVGVTYGALHGILYGNKVTSPD